MTTNFPLSPFTPSVEVGLTVVKKLLLTNGNRRGRGVFCCTYVNSESKACQELSRKNSINDWYAVNKENADWNIVCSWE